ncbi:DUF5926 family protein [Actinoplanes sp. N902-109]|uniref:DUF5926 family protein n=1 Tax=Actinoplanes sp. (strain N902-109) TaxID=649831 RepID=UPI0003294F41|nr:DUF5926 family protein [Actinoplanes sp. N902-109]AGL21635.1 hypothetical protein L083_8125 [Actinoplanes sp. N902-109]
MSKRRKNPRAADAAPKREKIKDIFVARPFEGLADETEWIALRELVPAASAPLALKPEIIEEYGDRPVTLSTVLPMAWPAMTRQDGRVFVGLQRHVQSGDVSRDIAVAILRALQTTPGDTVSVPALPGPGVRLQDVLADGPLDITMHEGFEYWLDEQQIEDPNVKASLERANASIYPTVRMSAAHAAYWCRVPDKAHVRWVLPEPEDTALDALARLSAAGDLLLGEGTKFAGMFRAHGLLVPVWDLPGEPEAAEWEAPVADFAKRYADILAETGPLDAAARRAKQGLVGRQLTLR